MNESTPDCTPYTHPGEDRDASGRRKRRPRPPAPDGHSVCFGQDGCGQTLPVEAFHIERNGKPRSVCVECYRGVKRREQQRRSPEQQRVTYMRWKYGIEPEDFDKLYHHQGAACALCERYESDCPEVPSGGKRGTVSARRLVVEHNHANGKVRGLTCAPCNHLLGQLEQLPVDVREHLASDRVLAYLATPPAMVVGVGQRGHHTEARRRYDTAA